MIKTLDISIWGRMFSLPVDYDCYENEAPTQIQIDALTSISSQKALIEKSKALVEDYCRAAVMEDAENEKKDNIFSYAVPHYVYVKREEPRPRVALMCRYRYDPEHGLAIVFCPDGKVMVGIQDIIL